MPLALNCFGDVVNECAKAFPQFFREAVKTPVSILGLMIVLLALLAWCFFKKANSRVTIPIFFSLFAAVVLFTFAFFPIHPPQSEKDTPAPAPSPSSPIVNGSPLPTPNEAPKQEGLTSMKPKDQHTPKRSASNSEHRSDSRKLTGKYVDTGESSDGIRTLFCLPGRLLWSFFDVLSTQRIKDALRPTTIHTGRSAATKGS
jgi:hypothetical protein